MLTFDGQHTAAADAGLFDDHEPIRLIDSFEDSAVFHLDLTGRVVNWNRGAERLFGRTAAGFGSRDYTFLLRSVESGSVKPRQPLRTALAKGLFRITAWRTRTDGTCFWGEVLISPLIDETRRATGFLAVVRDRTDHKRRIARLRAALDISEAVMGDHPLERALQLVVRRARSLVHADGAHMTVPAAGSERAMISVAEGWNARLLQGANLPVSRSVMARVMESGRPCIVDDASLAPGRSKPLAGAARVGPILAVPLARRRRQIGTLVVYNRVGRPRFRRKDLELLRRFAGNAALAVQHAETRHDHRRTIVKERERLARVLQSGAVRSLSRVVRGLDDVTAWYQDPALRERLASCVAIIDSAVEDLRSCTFGLRPRILNDHRLDQALRLLARDLELRAGLPTMVEMQTEAAEQLTEHAGDVIQIVREALSNVSRHARAQHCRLRLRIDRGKTSLEIEDDGIGFDLQQVRGQRDGLRNLRERVARIGGQLRIETAPGAGTALRVAISGGRRIFAHPRTLLAPSASC